MTSVNKGDSASATDQGSRNLVTRVLAALVLAPLALLIAWVGGWFWIVLVIAAASGLYIEWSVVVGAGRDRRALACGIVALIIAGLCLGLGHVDAALLVVAVGIAAVAILSRQSRQWMTAGICYAVAAELAAILIRLDANYGFSGLIFVLLVVWATDIGGYFAGRSIGGPKLWPRVSPKKTWAGAIGGFLASIAVAVSFAAASSSGKTLPFVLAGAVLSIVGQFGDLFESAIKRRFGVKDSSHVIPGHGGLLDRLDGFVAAIVVAALFGFLRGDAHSLGRALVVW